jgi:hypothetical protein
MVRPSAQSSSSPPPQLLQSQSLFLGAHSHAHSRAHSRMTSSVLREKEKDSEKLFFILVFSLFTFSFFLQLEEGLYERYLLN